MPKIHGFKADGSVGALDNEKVSSGPKLVIKNGVSVREDSIGSAQTDKSQTPTAPALSFKQQVREFFLNAWDWICKNILCCCFKEKETNSSESKKELTPVYPSPIGDKKEGEIMKVLIRMGAEDDEIHEFIDIMNAEKDIGKRDETIDALIKRDLSYQNVLDIIKKHQKTTSTQ